MKAPHVQAITFVTIVNLLCSAVGIFQWIFITRMLGPETLGVVAILAGLAGVVLNFLDLRLQDTVCRLYYADTIKADDLGRLRAAVILVGLLFQCGIGALAFMVCMVIVPMGLPLFSDVSPGITWALLVSVTAVLDFVSSLAVYVQRLTERFWWLGLHQLASTLIRAGIILWCIRNGGTADVYLRTLLIALTVTCLYACYSSVHIWRGQVSWLIGRNDWLVAIRAYRSNFKFILASNMVGYLKMLHRAADVLMVGYFCNDRMTGLYKLARSASDALYVLHESLNKFLQPTLLRLLSASRFTEFRSYATWIFRLSFVGTFLGVCVELGFLPGLVHWLFGERFQGAEPMIILLSLPLFFVLGLGLWVWPLLVHSGSMRLYIINHAAGVVVGQYILGPLVFLATGASHPEWLAAGYVASYFLTYMVFMRQIFNQYSFLGERNV